ncbi:hypothetical protein F66182_9614 [Fusarium sp. NRRL 66182]|nr:hypothetical protein F66182_9614 [Fusarium sp. NRRL 66182]
MPTFTASLTSTNLKACHKSSTLSVTATLEPASYRVATVRDIIPILKIEEVTHKAVDTQQTTRFCLFRAAVPMESAIRPFSGSDVTAKIVANKAANRREAAIVGGVMIGSILFVVLAGVGFMFYNERIRKRKLREAKNTAATDSA